MPDKEREEESSGFKVVDRRLFTPEGERRPDAQPDAPKGEKSPEARSDAKAGGNAAAPPPLPKKPGAAPDAAPEPDAQAHGERLGPVDFSQLVMSLATTAMFQLGLVQSHEGDQPRADLPAAKETIDLLDILQQKTKGNLTQEEEGLLAGSLYDLRMAFVELSRAGRGR